MLSISLLEQARKLYGTSAAEKILFLHFQERAKSYVAKVQGATPLDRAKSFARLRDREGHMADFELEPGPRIIERHHPMQALFTAFPEAVAMERDLVQRVLGAPVRREQRQAGGPTSMFTRSSAPEVEAGQSAEGDSEGLARTAGRIARRRPRRTRQWRPEPVCALVLQVARKTSFRVSEIFTMSLDIPALELAARDARGLGMDAVAKAKSGHLGLPLGATEIGAVLYGHALNHCPDNPRWLNRDRFVLSAGHGSMFLYGWLHLSGYDVPLDQIRSFRQLHSITPGHPECRETPGVEATTGPLGQGVSNAVGYAISSKMCEQHFNTPAHKIFDHHIVCLAGDGCLQEGISQEASALAAHLALDNLILFYDSNNVTLDAMAPVTQSEDTAARFKAYGWDVYEIDGHDLREILNVFEKAKAATTGKPQFIVAKTLIGKGIPEVSGTNKAHGEAGVKFVEAARKAIGLPEEPFFVSL
jgi:transketolase N-terminal domain/subunit